MKTVIIEDKQRVEEIISRCDICFVGITDQEGNPYVRSEEHTSELSHMPKSRMPSSA